MRAAARAYNLAHNVILDQKCTFFEFMAKRLRNGYTNGPAAFSEPKGACRRPTSANYFARSPNSLLLVAIAIWRSVAGPQDFSWREPRGELVPTRAGAWTDGRQVSTACATGAAMRGHWRDCARHRFLLSRQAMWRWRSRSTTSRTTPLASSTRSCCFSFPTSPLPHLYC